MFFVFFLCLNLSVEVIECVRSKLGLVKKLVALSEKVRQFAGMK